MAVTIYDCHIFVTPMVADKGHYILLFCIVRRVLCKEPQYATVKTEYKTTTRNT